MAHLIVRGQRDLPATGTRGRALPARCFPLAAFALAFQVFAVFVLPLHGAGGVARSGLILASLLPLFIWVFLNRRWLGVCIAGLGLALNALAMLVNGGLMPVYPDAVARAGLSPQLRSTSLGGALPHTKDVLRTPASTRLAPLRDQFVFRPSASPGHIFSPGDLLVYGGLLVVLGEVLLHELLLGSGAAESLEAAHRE